MRDQCALLRLDLPLAEALRHERLGPEAAQAGASIAGALADPTRLTLALALRDGGELCGCDLAWIAERAENLVSHHLRTLRATGLVTSRREGKMLMSSLTERGRELVDVLVDPSAPARVTANASATRAS